MERMKVVDLKALTKDRGLRGYSKLKKSRVDCFSSESTNSSTRPPKPIRPPPPPPQMSTWEPFDDKPRQAPPLVRFRPDRPRQPELLRHSQPPDSQNPRSTLKPYQLKPKRGKETFIEPPVEQPPLNQKQIKRMKKKSGKLNKKIRHSKRKHNNLISKRNSIKKRSKN